MYFEEVLPALRQGAKIRLEHWAKGEYIFLKQHLLDERGGEYWMTGDEFFAQDWEIYDEEIQG